MKKKCDKIQHSIIIEIEQNILHLIKGITINNIKLILYTKIRNE